MAIEAESETFWDDIAARAPASNRALACRDDGREYALARENPMFPPEVTRLIRFVRCREKTPCTLCGKRRKRHWTMVVPFEPCEFGDFSIPPARMTVFGYWPVCEDHLLKPCFYLGAAEDAAT